MERFVIRTARPATPDDTQSAAAAAAALVDLAGLPSSPSQAAGHTSDSVSMHVGPVSRLRPAVTGSTLSLRAPQRQLRTKTSPECAAIHQ